MAIQIKKISFLIVLLSFFSVCKAQTDSTQIVRADSVSTDTAQKAPKEWSKPEKAALMSAILPGLGQFYNKKYWKIPIVWIGEGVLLTAVFYNHSQYKEARDLLINNDWEAEPLIEGTIGNNRVITEGNYKTVRDIHRRNRDYYIILSSLLYGLNIVDAVVDAHLSEFDLSDDLSLNIKPNIYSISNTFAAGVTLNLRLK